MRISDRDVLEKDEEIIEVAPDGEVIVEEEEVFEEHDERGSSHRGKDGGRGGGGGSDSSFREQLVSQLI